MQHISIAQLKEKGYRQVKPDRWMKVCSYGSGMQEEQIWVRGDVALLTGVVLDFNRPGYVIDKWEFELPVTENTLPTFYMKLLDV